MFRCAHHRDCQYKALKGLRLTRQPEVVTGKDPRHSAGCGYDVPFWRLAIEQAVGIINALTAIGVNAESVRVAFSDLQKFLYEESAV